MKKYFAVLMMLAFAALTFGLVCPYLISMDSWVGVFMGIAIIVLQPPFYIHLFRVYILPTKKECNK